jgi:hypothetical protein
MNSRDGAMAQSRDAVCDGLCDDLCDHRGLCVSISSLQASAIVEPKATRHMYSVSRPLWCLCGSSCSSCFNLVRGCFRDRRCFQGSMRTTGGPPDFRTPTHDSTLHLRDGFRCRSDKRLDGSVATPSASFLKHKGHEEPQRGPQSIAFESGTSVPERHTTLWADGCGFNGLFETQRTLRPLWPSQRNTSRSHRNRGRMTASGLKDDLTG